jgi:hypothetical protein
LGADGVRRLSLNCSGSSSVDACGELQLVIAGLVVAACKRPQGIQRFATNARALCLRASGGLIFTLTALLMEFPGLSFSPGLKIQAMVWERFSLPITRAVPTSSSFALVVSFGRCKFCLSDVSVGSFLQAAIGGVADHFHVSQLSPRVFKFLVSSHLVGFFVRRLIFFECNCFKLYFHLWGGGGPNWRNEFSVFLHEEEASWSKPKNSAFISGRKKKKPSFAEIVKNPPLSGANQIPLGHNPTLTQPKQPRRSAFGRIEFPKTTAFDRILSGTFRPKPANSSLVHRKVQKVFSHQSSSSVLEQRNRDFNLAPCSRCLSSSHSRTFCKNAIKCFVCLGLGHVAAVSEIQILSRMFPWILIQKVKKLTWPNLLLWPSNLPGFALLGLLGHHLAGLQCFSPSENSPFHLL